MRELSYAEAIREALAEEMERDENVFVMGEDVEIGYVFTVTRGLIDRFGRERVRDTPISEAVIAGTAVGAAMTGSRPVAEIQFSDFMTLCMDQIVNQAAKMRYMTGGQATVPLVIRTPMGAVRSFAAQHSQCLHAWFVHIPGLKVVAPSTPADAKGLLKSAIRDDNPVIFFEHKRLYNVKGLVPDGDVTVPLGVADVKRAGRDVTIVATSNMVPLALGAAATLAKEGIEASVVDPRTLRPLDIGTIVEDVKRTSRLVVVDEGAEMGGFASEVAAQVAQRAIEYLDGPILRVGLLDTPVPYYGTLEDAVLPNEARVVEAVRTLLA